MAPHLGVIDEEADVAIVECPSITVADLYNNEFHLQAYIAINLGLAVILAFRYLIFLWHKKHRIRPSRSQNLICRVT
jgi:hypothetical protein